ncbi:hypothetical protein Kpol_365p4 [Vanderwaltozyma polyspora DSM 70294]|uniref:ATP-dependent helicase IRC3 n=1 Tax=Vanderwaltozyma polyspora (strain ATCC 22028 / DSM 70294 / BCRC 21397 / CBS 2163 / NBRC 10782 / NRRL Y-8283 / UCD 57-17) TaxID=436907 RepID=A7TS02_VANPO|nr:uncharacterized protein Kpol_365p4 [Vanderwaltozyma polyspora DSM 70294]EDO14949.1 hypothetical protein Kpol_365p4 [Vanderwaltozyma polyspora DSM 70294]
MIRACKRIVSSGLSISSTKFARQSFRSLMSLVDKNNAKDPKLRDYQQTAIDKCIESIDSGTRRIGVSMATGGGKTVIFSNLINQLKHRHIASQTTDSKFRSLILVHRKELALQAADVIKTFGDDDANVQIEMGKFKCDVESSDVIIASVQSLIRRLDKYSADDINLIIIDEAHHAAAKTYINILKHFNTDVPETKIPVVGFSATFERADNKSLSCAIDEIVYHRGIVEMIDENWLCEGKFTTVDIKLELNDVESVGSDFKINQLSKVMNTDEINQVILKTYQAKKLENNLKSTLLFAVDVDHVIALCDLFNKNGVNAEYVLGSTNDVKRDETIKDFKNGKIEVLVNCGIFTEGTDIPSIDCILLGRPTKSRSLLIQMIGRGLRLHHSKSHCHIIDFIGAANVGVVSVPTLAGIDECTESLSELTLEDLREIKQEIDAKISQQQRKEEEQQNIIKEQFNELVKNVTSFDLTLTTFEDFKSFNESTNQSKYKYRLSTSLNELTQLRQSKYPWVRISDKAWASPIFGDAHLRLYKERDKPNDSSNSSLVDKYVLKLYRQLPTYVPKGGGIRFVPKELIVSEDIKTSLGKAQQVMEKISSDEENNEYGNVKNFSKYAKWRSKLASPKQKTLIRSKLKSLNNSSNPSPNAKDDLKIDDYIKTMTKGDASNILFASQISSVFPIRALLKMILYDNKN